MLSLSTALIDPGLKPATFRTQGSWSMALEKSLPLSEREWREEKMCSACLVGFCTLE